MATGLGSSSPFGVGGYEVVNHPQYMSAISSAVDPDKMEQMLDDPQYQGMLEQMMQDPDTMRQLMEENPMMKSMMNNNPMMKQVFSNPALLKMVFSTTFTIQTKTPSRKLRNILKMEALCLICRAYRHKLRIRIHRGLRTECSQIFHPCFQVWPIRHPFKTKIQHQILQFLALLS